VGGNRRDEGSGRPVNIAAKADAEEDRTISPNELTISLSA